MSVAETASRLLRRATSPGEAGDDERVSSQAGIFEGLDPSVWNPSDPIILFIIQATIVITLTRVLFWPLSKIREPRVIAEVITGVILGPSIMGRIPGFTETIFPPESMPPFLLAANLGLILFLFLVGLEINLNYLLSNWRVAISVASLDMAIPFGLGVAIAYGLYHEFSDEPGIAPISFGVFALFIGVAMAITAFPVLCRILTSLKLLNTNVGVIVLSSGIANDVVGWVLLALCVTLVNSGAGVTAVYVLLTAVGWALFLAYAVRPVFMWILRRTHSLEQGPSEGVVALTILMVLASAFFTSVIGVHSIFGAFMVGLMCPHEGGFAIKLTEKIEDLVSSLLVPLFFANAGINTDIALLDNAVTWGYVVAIIVIAFLSKIIGGTIGARINGLVWRESITIGTLMSCKGLVELIVLNIGREAGILSTRTFTMFVVMALVTTFATAPATSFLYPPAYQRKLQLWKQGRIDWDGNPIVAPGQEGDDDDQIGKEPAGKILAYLRTDGLSTLLSTISLFTMGQQQRANPDGSSSSSASEQPAGNEKSAAGAATTPASATRPAQKPLRVHGHRIVELSERNSSVMKVSEIEEYVGHDPIIKAFGTCANNTTRDVVVSGQLAVVPQDSFADTLVTEASNAGSDMILVPWSETGTVAELPSFLSTAPRADVLASNNEFSTLVADIFDRARTTCAAATYIDSTLLSAGETEGGGGGAARKPRPLTRQVSGISGGSLSEVHDPSSVKFYSADASAKRSVFVLYTGAKDDILAVRLGIQLAQNSTLQVTVVEAASADSPGHALYGSIKDGVLEDEDAASRITFAEMTTAHGGNIPLLASGFLSSRTDTNRPSILLLGRSVGASGNVPDIEGGSSSAAAASSEPANVIGSVATAVAAQARKTGVTNVSLMVVQAKQAAETHQAQRKLSVMSQGSLNHT